MRDLTSSRSNKEHLLGLFTKADFNTQLASIRAMPPKRVISPLISLLCATDERVKWRSVLAIGAVVSGLAETDMESAREIMRRLMWHLNDESGGIGWGVPEAMGEIMACSPELAHEYSFIIVSYLRPDGNYIEHPMLQRGVLWGFGRLAHARPGLVADAPGLLPPYLTSEDALIRGLAAYAAGALPLAATESFLRRLTADNTKITVFLRDSLTESTVGRLAQSALGKFK